MLKKLLLSVALVFWAGYSSSESISPYYGYTGNAAAGGMTWDMSNVLPEPPGLDINTVIYRYTPIKDPNDPFTVTVQNEDAVRGGYIFRSTDDWSGKPGGIELRRVIGVGSIPREYWGTGSIETTGFGTVLNPNVVYTYKVNPCFDPQFDPNCPGYKTPTVEIPEVVMPPLETFDVSTLYDATDGDAEIAEVDRELLEVDDKEELSDEEKEKRKKKADKKKEIRLEQALAAKDNSALFAEAFAQSLMLQQMNTAINMQQYNVVSIDGGTYTDTVVMDGGNIPDNKNGRRLNLQSQILHEKLIDMQYNR